MDQRQILLLQNSWRNGTWDLNMLVKEGKMDWDRLIVAGECLIIQQHYNHSILQKFVFA